MSSDARGSVSGIQFSGGRYGSIVGRKSTSTKAANASCLEIRSHFAMVSDAWSQLPEAWKSRWALAQRDAATPRIAFFRVQLLRLAAGLAMTAAPADTQTSGKPVFLNFQLTPDTPPRLFCTWQRDAPASSKVMIYYCPSTTLLDYIHPRHFKLFAAPSLHTFFLLKVLPVDAPFYTFRVRTLRLHDMHLDDEQVFRLEQ